MSRQIINIVEVLAILRLWCLKSMAFKKFIQQIEVLTSFKKPRERY